MTAFYIKLILDLPWFCYLKTLFSTVNPVVECMYVQSLCTVNSMITALLIYSRAEMNIYTLYVIIILGNLLS